MTVENLEIEVSELRRNTQSSIDALTRSLSEMKAQLDGVSQSTSKLKTSANGSSGAMGKLMKSIGRIAFYRVLRAVLKEVAQAFSEGLKNAYHFSKAVGYELADSMDALATKSLTMKNQLGAAFGGLLQAVQPILLQIIALITQAANALAAFFGIFNGGQYLKAKDTATAWDKATGAAKKYKNTILGFDEINRLDEPSGGGGGSSANYADMFDVVDIPPWAQKVSDFLTDLKLRFRNVYGEWGNLDTQKIKETVLNNLPTIAGCTLIGGIVGGTRGAILGLTVGLLLSFLDTLDPDGELLGSDIVQKIKDYVLPVAGAIIGWKLLGGGLLGLTLGTILGFSIRNELQNTEGRISWDTIINSIYNSGVLPIGGAILGWKLTHSAAGALVGFTVGSILGFFIKDFGIDGGKLTLNKVITAICNDVLPAATGFIAGFMLTGGNIAGAVIGMTIGVALSFIVKSVDWGNVEKQMKGTIRESYAYNATAYASGGFPARGDLFIAGEAGAEIVSSNGGQTQVSNTDQIAYSVQAGNGVVVDAIYAMANAIVSSVDRKDTNPIVTIGDRDVYRAWERGSSTVGGNLVHG